jgi:putative transposase
VCGIKTFSARRINALRHSPGYPVWQRSFYDHIIRDEADWHRTRYCIDTNPTRWLDDREFRL